MYDAVTEQGSGKLMQRYGEIFRENKLACERILKALQTTPRSLMHDDLEWLRRQAWKQAQEEINCLNS